MTTMNNTLNTICKPEYITMRCTIVNGESWDFLMNISSLADDEVTPVINWMVNGELDEHYNTPKIRKFLMEAIEAAAEVLMRFCFDNGKYNHFYALELISEIEKAGLRCEECCIEEVMLLHQLFVEYLKNPESAVEQIAVNLYEFFADTAPFAFNVI